VVGTPGRLLDLVQKNVLNLKGASTVVLDEADEMLSMGFIEDVESILGATAAKRQTALFSATLPQRIRRLADRYMNKPQSFTAGPRQLTVDSIEQRYYLVNATDKLAALTRLFEVEPITSALIFTRTRIGTGELVNELAQRGFPAEALNGDLSQEARVQVLNRFRDGKIKVLVATDVAARGLDIDNISHVFNYDLPQDPEVYVHRIGRTGRAGKTGIAISLLAPNERWNLRKIESYVKLKFAAAKLPSAEDIRNHREAALVEKIMIWLKRGRCSREREIVTRLAEDGYDPSEIAAIALKLARDKERRRPIAKIREVQESNPSQKRPAAKRSRSRNGRTRPTGSHERGMVRLALNTGRAAGVEVKHIVGSLAHFADIPGRLLGRIKLGERLSYVDVPGQLVEQVLAKTANYKIGRQAVTVERA
jgi:ATP-dependent RNA helicase DeaD